MTITCGIQPSDVTMAVEVLHNSALVICMPTVALFPPGIHVHIRQIPHVLHGYNYCWQGFGFILDEWTKPLDELIIITAGCHPLHGGYMVLYLLLVCS